MTLIFALRDGNCAIMGCDSLVTYDNNTIVLQKCFKAWEVCVQVVEDDGTFGFDHSLWLRKTVPPPLLPHLRCSHLLQKPRAAQRRLQPLHLTRLQGARD